MLRKRQKTIAVVVSLLLVHFIVLSLMGYSHETLLDKIDAKSVLADLKTMLGGESTDTASRFRTEVAARYKDHAHEVLDYMVSLNPDPAFNEVLVGEENKSKGSETKTVGTGSETKTESKGSEKSKEAPSESSSESSSSTSTSSESSSSTSTSSESSTNVSFDPRFTLGLLLHHVEQGLAAGKVPELPFFHWADYVDLTDLAPYFDGQRLDCRGFDFRRSRGSPLLDALDPKDFCVNDADIDARRKEPVPENVVLDADVYVKNLQLIAESPRRLTFHTFANAGRAAKKLRVIQAQQYLYEFMPFAESITLVLPNASSVVIPVAPQDVQPTANNKLRMRDSELHAAYVQKHGATLNIPTKIDAVAKLASTTGHLTEPYHRELNHRQFVDNTAEYLLALENSDSLSRAESLYLAALKYSQAEENPPKYFGEAKLVHTEKDWDHGSHHDWRFFRGLATGDTRANALHGLISAWLRFTRGNGVATWIAHGTLLSWYWNALTFPWDNDFDVQMPIDDLHLLARRFNQTLVVDFGPDPQSGEVRYGRYFLDCGAFVSQRTRGNGNNNIDARFIDVDTGTYIDITALAVTDTVPPHRYDGLKDKVTLPELLPAVKNNQMQLYHCRNYHFLQLAELLPLRLTLFEGEFAYVPNAFQQALVNEYSLESITSMVFNKNVFVPRLKLWLPQIEMRRFISARPHLHVQGPEGEPLPLNKGSARAIFDKFSDEDYLDLLFSSDDFVGDYMVLQSITEFHEVEILKLLSGEDAKDMFYHGEDLLVHPTVLRHDPFTYRSWEKARKERKQKGTNR